MIVGEMKRVPLIVLVVVSAVIAVALVSCQQPQPVAPESVNTMWSATTMPTTQTAKLLGFNFPPAPAGSSGVGRESDDEVKAFSRSCLACHAQTDNHTMHETKSVQLACVDCHGGHPNVNVPENLSRSDPRFRVLMLAAHV